MRWFVVFIVSVVSFAYQFDCTRSCKEACGTDYVCQIECHTCCPIEDVQRELDCRMCKGYWFLDSCHLAQAGQTNLKPYIYSIGADPKKAIVPFNTTVECKALDPDGIIVQYEWDMNGDNVADKTTSHNAIVLQVDTINDTTIGCRAKDNRGAFSEWNRTKVTGAHGLALQKGWNLVSLPTNSPLSLSNFSDVVIAWKYDNGAWTYYTSDRNLSSKLTHLGYTATITQLEPKSGYWVYAARAFVIPCTGASFGLDITSLQKNRWYLVGSSHTITASQMGQFSNIKIWWKWKGRWYGWSKDTLLYNVLRKNGFTLIERIEPTEGFWVKTQ